MLTYILNKTSLRVKENLTCTWLATKDKDKLEMAIVLEGDPVLFNQYGVMAVNPQKHRHVKYKEAMEFINWLISKEGQQTIASF